jgi:hypothetical protein
MQRGSLRFWILMNENGKDTNTKSHVLADK